MSSTSPSHTYRIELTPPDITSYQAGNTGTPYVTTFDSGKPGPHVMVQALTHGNELCGAIALDFLFREGVRPVAGRLTFAFANIEAFASWDTSDPNRSRYVDEDYNRVWSDDTLKGERNSTELRRARELVKFVDAADFLLDIHSMHDPCAPIMVCGATGEGGEKSAAFARKMQVPQNLLIDTGHPAGLRMIERGPFRDPRAPQTAILIECGQHWESSSVDVAIDTALRFLQATGVVESSFVKSRLRIQPTAAQTTINVTHAVVAKSLSFRFAGTVTGLQVIAKAGDPIAYDGDEVIVAPYDNTVLVMPSMAHLKVGTTMVRLGRATLG
ncbi:MAG: succinylglutamate desuccinylase [Alcaligenaceae bacterium]|nr:MAG: succinylglutamate desuccinylase [Alcaligenaceae bacterium]